MSKVKVEMKVYGLPFQNSKGYNIGRVTHRLKGSLPYTEIDQINHFLYNLYGWASKQSLEFDERTQKKIDNANKDFKANYFQSFDKSMDFIPIPGNLAVQAPAPKKTFKDSSVKIKEGKLQIGEPKVVRANDASNASNASNASSASNRTSSSNRTRSSGGGKKTRKPTRSNKSKTRKKK